MKTLGAVKTINKAEFARMADTSLVTLNRMETRHAVQIGDPNYSGSWIQDIGEQQSL